MFCKFYFLRGLRCFLVPIATLASPPLESQRYNTFALIIAELYLIH